MPVLTTDTPAKQITAIYHSPQNQGVKNFAARVRNDNPVDTVLIWSRNFNVDDVLFAHAIVVEKGCAKEEQIVRFYERAYPETEIHYMTNEGQWYVEEQAPRESVVSAPAAASHGAAAASAAEQATPTPIESLGVDSTDDGASAESEEFQRPAGYEAPEQDDLTPSPADGSL